MSRKRKPNLKLRDEVIPELKAYWQVQEFGPYHVRVSSPDSENTVEVWATAGKCMQTGAHQVYIFKNWGELKKFISEVIDA